MILTIITINYNNASGLKKTMESVLNQTFSDFEYVVIDGGSTDGSKEIIEEYIPAFEKRIKWISEPDAGIYNAMNKGIRIAKGEYVQFLNSGDWLVDNHVLQNLLSQLNSDIVVGNLIQVNENGKMKYCQHDTPNTSFYTFYRGTIQHSSAYIKRELFLIYGHYDESFKIVSDWKWYLEAIILGTARVKFIDDYISFFDMTGVSSVNLTLSQSERRTVMSKLIPQHILSDYDTYSFDIDQMQRIKRYPLIYKMLYIIERLLFKYDKLILKYFAWK